MPGKLVIGVIGDLRREGYIFLFIKQGANPMKQIYEGEYVCSRCTVFGLECDEVQVLIRSGFRMTDCNKDEEGVEVKSSIFKVLRGLGKELGYEIQGDPVSTEAPGGRTSLIYTLTKDL